MTERWSPLFVWCHMITWFGYTHLSEFGSIVPMRSLLAQNHNWVDRLVQTIQLDMANSTWLWVWAARLFRAVSIESNVLIVLCAGWRLWLSCILLFYLTVPAANPITYMPHPAGVTAAPGGAQSAVQAPPSHQLPQQQTPQNIQFVAPPTANAPPGEYSCTAGSISFYWNSFILWWCISGLIPFVWVSCLTAHVTSQRMISLTQTKGIKQFTLVNCISLDQYVS